jgi:hypothetical protein
LSDSAFRPSSSYFREASRAFLCGERRRHDGKEHDGKIGVCCGITNPNQFILGSCSARHRREPMWTDCGHGYGFNAFISVIRFLVQERVLSNRTEASNRSLALRSCVEILAQQLEELEQLRDRVRRAEAKAIGVWRRRRSSRKRRAGCSSVRCGSRMVR